MVKGIDALAEKLAAKGPVRAALRRARSRQSGSSMRLLGISFLHILE
jgi:hypothetical protein